MCGTGDGIADSLEDEFGTELFCEMYAGHGLLRWRTRATHKRQCQHYCGDREQSL